MTASAAASEASDRRQQRRRVLFAMLAVAVAVLAGWGWMAYGGNTLCPAIAMINEDGSAIDCMAACSYRAEFERLPDWIVDLRHPQARDVIASAAACP